MENTQQEQIKDMCIEVANIVIKHLPLTYHLRYGKTIDEIIKILILASSPDEPSQST